MNSQRCCMVEREVGNILVHMGVLPERLFHIAPDGPTAGAARAVGGADYFVYGPEHGLFEPLV